MRRPGPVTVDEFEQLLSRAWAGTVVSDTGLDDATTTALEELAAAPLTQKPACEQNARSAYARTTTP